VQDKVPSLYPHSLSGTKKRLMFSSRKSGTKPTMIENPAIM